MQFDLPKELSSLIKVVGVGGGGSNAVNHMFQQGINGVDFIVCNTDQQALDISPVPTKLVLGTTLTKGRGAGSKPEVGRNAAQENIDDIRNLLGNNTEMVFITAGMGGGTGTGAAPVIAETAKDLGILTVGIVTVPFAMEGKRRREQALEGIREMRKHVDSLIVINNDKLREIYGNLKASQSFAKADDVLATAAKGIADIITTTLQINTDINDVKTVMSNSGVAIMGTSLASGENRAMSAVEQALSSPLLNDNEIKGAKYVLLNIACAAGDNEIGMDELGEIIDYVQEAAGNTAEIIQGYGIDDSLGDNLSITIIATGFTSKEVEGVQLNTEPEKKVMLLTPDDSEGNTTASSAPLVSPDEIDHHNEEERVTIEAPGANTEDPTEPYLVVREVEEDPVAKAKEVELEITNITSVSSTEKTESSTDEEVSAETSSSEEVSNESSGWESSESTSSFESSTSDSVENSTSDSTNELEESKAEETLESPIADASSNIENVETFANNVLSDSSSESESYEKEESTAPSYSNEVEEESPESETGSTPTAETEEQTDASTEEQISNEEQIRKAKERIMKLKELSYKLKTPSGLNELENEPAYKRRNVQLDDTPHSSESEVSKFTLSPEEGDDKKTNIKPNNSFLHDNVD